MISNWKNIPNEDVEKMSRRFQETEAGILPIDWEYGPIGNVARLESGHTPSKREPKYWTGSIPWVSLHDTSELDGGELFVTAQTISQDGLDNSSARLLPKGTVTFSRTATVGKTTILGREMATSQDFANYVCGPLLFNQYLVYLFRSMSRVWKSLMAGSIHNTIYMPVFKALKIPLPPLSEQRAIASALSDVDALLAALDRLIAKKRDLKQAAMQQLLTGQTRLPGFKEEWTSTELGEAGQFLKGRGIKKDDVIPDGLPCIRYGEIYTHHNDHIRAFNSFVSQETAMQSQILKVGDLLFAGSGETAEEIGKCVAFLWDMEAYAGGDIVIFRAPLQSPEYLGYLMNHVSIQAQKARLGQGDAVVHISASNLSKIIVNLPSLKEQKAIATVLSDMDAELAALEQRLAKTRALKQGMMQELLTGRIRLVTPQSSPKVAHA